MTVFEIKEVIFNEYGVFIPYIDLIGRVDAVTMADVEGEV